MMNILLVDDAPDMRLVMKLTLESLDYRVTVAKDGVQAWQYLQQDVFHVVITDWEMPYMDGIGLCRYIRQTRFLNYVYIILLTGRSGKNNLITGMDAGADDFATKPVGRDEMAVLLRAAERVIFLERKLAQKNQHLAEANHSLQRSSDETQRDLNNAAKLQSGILPPQRQLGPLNYAWFFQPAKAIGGDTFNYFSLSPQLQFFYTVDVSGHGISSALLSMYLSNLLTSATERGEHFWQMGQQQIIKNTLADMLKKFNEHLLDLSDHYFTMILGIIDTRSEQLYLVQAGHPKPFLINKLSGTVAEIDLDGFPVGLLPDVRHDISIFPFRSEDRLVLFSDGLFEISDEPTQLITTGNLKKALSDSVDLSPQNAIRLICKYFLVDEHKASQPDDISMLMIDFMAPG